MPPQRGVRKSSSKNRPTQLVADVGNTRIKWGLCDGSTVVDSAALTPDNPDGWQKQIDKWRLRGRLEWAVAGVHPQRRDVLVKWLQERGDEIQVFTSCQQLPLKVAVKHPDRVGIDRLLNAVAVNSRRLPNIPTVIVDAGSAVTVDYLDKQGIFQGGAIFPGLRLMAKALHDYTALLPIVEPGGDFFMPGTSTKEAIQAGIFCAVVGGVRALIEELMENEPMEEGPQIFVGGGDAELLGDDMPQFAKIWPLMTLEGLRIAAWPAEGT